LEVGAAADGDNRTIRFPHFGQRVVRSMRLILPIFHLCLSDIKLAHTDDEVRQEMA
jgi:hypothetical protein